MQLDKYGPSWYNPKPQKSSPSTYKATTTEELVEHLDLANHGDIIQLTSSKYELTSPLKINKQITITSNSKKKVSLKYSGGKETAAFEMNPKGDLTLSSIKLLGTGENYAFATLQKNMSSHYNLTVKDCEVSDFDYVLKGYKYSFAQYVDFNSTIISSCANGIELSAEDDDRGDYNAENLFITNCEFKNVEQNVIDYYRGGYDESTVGGNLIIESSSFSKCGEKEKNGTLINTYGIINVDISESKFTDNKVKLVAQLWGAKKNSESGNTIKNSGKIITEQNLPQKMMY
jgi:poly(beta-D-mannuronate) lyase